MLCQAPKPMGAALVTMIVKARHASLSLVAALYRESRTVKESIASFLAAPDARLSTDRFSVTCKSEGRVLPR